MPCLSHISKADRSREEAIVESNYWNEGFQSHLHAHSTSYTNSHTEAAAGPDRERQLNYHSVVTHHVLADAPNLVMADAFPAEDSSATSYAATSTSGNVSPSPDSSAVCQDSDDALGRSDPDIDLDIESPTHDSSQPHFPEGSFSAVPSTSFDFNINPSYDAEDYELDMSDDEHGGVPLVEEMDDESVASDPFDSNEEDPGSEGGIFQGDYFPPFIPVGFQAFPMPPGDQSIINAGEPVPAGPGLGSIQVMMDPPLVSNPNPTMLGSDNLSLFDFLRDWSLRTRPWRFEDTLIAGPPSIQAVRQQDGYAVDEVRYSDLHGDLCDLQGMDWSALNTSRRIARHYRTGSYRNYTNRKGSDLLGPTDSDVFLSKTANFFRFKSLIVRRDVHLAHFQLRSVLACSSRTQAFYPGFQAIQRINVDSKTTDKAVNLNNVHGLGSVISTVDANHGILMAGMFNGEYCVKNLDSEDNKQFATGRIANNPWAITNHLQIHLPRRSSDPVAAIANNDRAFRVLDLATQKVVSQTETDYSVNCSAVSPDGRLRVLVGDELKVTIVDTDTGETQRELSSHKDYGFSCDWSDDGWMVATGNQDRTVKIWDARKWCDANGKASPLKTIRTQLAGARNLRFSPGGSGPRVLVVAEEADYIDIIDAQTLRSQQSFDLFGEIGGVAFTNEGQDLNVLCCDYSRGGLLQFERLGSGPEPFHNKHDWRRDAGDETIVDEPYRRRPGLLDELHHF